MLDSFLSRREKIYLVVVIVIFLSGATIRVLRGRHIIGARSEVVEFNISDSEEEHEHLVFNVQVEGFVNKPGIYEIPAGSRVKDAIELAGGALSNGEPRALNLVLPVAEGMRIYVPEKGAPLDEPDRYIDIGPNGYEDARSDVTVSSYQGPIIDINKATVEELSSLPGIGDVLAGEIVRYRENAGGFRSKSELLNVKGIGYSKYDAIKEYIKCE
ncbi:MAG TPA: hypothetical protein ENI43_02490 [Firmicutes bacterium]|nr:hypothetical protein [Bacillota bacterium]